MRMLLRNRTRTAITISSFKFFFEAHISIRAQLDSESFLIHH